MREAQRLLETTTLSVEVVAEAVGYGSAVGLRERFAAILGVSPLAYRRAFSSKANFPQAQTIAPGPVSLVLLNTVCSDDDRWSA